MPCEGWLVYFQLGFLSMPSILIQIVRFVDNNFPGWVECLLTDAESQVHSFIEKAPVVSLDPLTSTSTYPRGGFIPCMVEQEWQSAFGQDLVQVSTEHPYGVASATGRARFTLLKSQVI